MRAAKMAALRAPALPIAIVATGTPAGIWTVERSASIPITAEPGSGTPIIHFQNAGYLLSNIKMKIEAARYLSWKAAHYLDCHDFEGQEGGALSKIFCGELAVSAVSDAMRVVGVNSYLKDYPLDKLMRDVLCFPIYDAGNMGMQRRRLHGIMADPSYNPLAFAQNLKTRFTKSMHGVDSVPGHEVQA